MRSHLRAYIVFLITSLSLKQALVYLSDVMSHLQAEARLPGIDKQSATTDSLIAESSGEDGPSWPRAKSWNSASIAACVVLAGEARPYGVAKQSATTKPEFAETSGEAGPSWPRANGMISAAATAAAKSAGEAQPHGMAKQSATTKLELA